MSFFMDSEVCIITVSNESRCMDMKFLGSLIFWIVFVIVFIPILFFAPGPFAIFALCYLLFCVGLAMIRIFVKDK